MSRLFFGALVLGSLVSFSACTVSAARAEEIDEFDVETTTASPVNPTRPQAREDSWYYNPSTEQAAAKTNPRQIIQAKAMARGQQRADRLAALNWYGMYNGRPTAQSTPFCNAAYSPTWRAPYGSGFSWRQGPTTYIVTGDNELITR
jgi:hypothetical protein